MELELQSPLSLVPNFFSVLVSPVEVLVDSLNYNLKELQRLQALYISGNYSRILDRLDRRFTELDVRRAFTAYQLLTILKEAYQTLIILEHDPSLFEDASEMAEYIGQALKESSNGSSVLLYSPWTDRHLDEISKFADRVFVYNEVPKYVYKRASKKVKPGPRGQRTLEAF
jgi:DNA polymerase I